MQAAGDRYRHRRHARGPDRGLLGGALAPAPVVWGAAEVRVSPAKGRPKLCGSVGGAPRAKDRAAPGGPGGACYRRPGCAREQEAGRGDPDERRALPRRQLRVRGALHGDHRARDAGRGRWLRGGVQGDQNTRGRHGQAEGRHGRAGGACEARDQASLPKEAAAAYCVPARPDLKQIKDTARASVSHPDHYSQQCRRQAWARHPKTNEAPMGDQCPKPPVEKDVVQQDDQNRGRRRRLGDSRTPEQLRDYPRHCCGSGCRPAARRRWRARPVGGRGARAATLTEDPDKPPARPHRARPSAARRRR